MHLSHSHLPGLTLVICCSAEEKNTKNKPTKITKMINKFSLCWLPSSAGICAHHYMVQLISQRRSFNLNPLIIFVKQFATEFHARFHLECTSLISYTLLLDVYSNVFLSFGSLLSALHFIPLIFVSMDSLWLYFNRLVHLVHIFADFQKSRICGMNHISDIDNIAKKRIKRMWKKIILINEPNPWNIGE